MLLALGCAALKAWVGIPPGVTWLAVPGSGARYLAPEDWDAGRVGPALHQAEAQLALHTRCDVPRLDAAYSFRVMPWQSWASAYTGQPVGGETIGTISDVTVSLDSLAHEMAHACEFQQQGGPDAAHVTWADGGKWDADRAYRAWLAGGSAQ